MSKIGLFFSLAKPESINIIKNSTKYKDIDKTEVIWNRNIRKDIKVEFKEKDTLIIFCNNFEREYLEFLNLITYDIIPKKSSNEIACAIAQWK
ncbi:hypothetical protein MXB_3878 [Myxobolus squamalis]|nr:hypothetical protein MXB_3878 [Myxobolus squamalis]